MDRVNIGRGSNRGCGWRCSKDIVFKFANIVFNIWTSGFRVELGKFVSEQTKPLKKQVGKADCKTFNQSSQNIRHMMAKWQAKLAKYNLT
jgi:hypothetical protein